MKFHAIIEIPIYNQEILVSVNQNNEELESVLDFIHISEKDKLELFERENNACAMDVDGGGIIIRLPNYKPSPYNNGILVHEVFHACEFIFWRIGAPVEAKGHEPFAYLLGYLSEQVFKAIEENTNTQTQYKQLAV